MNAVKFFALISVFSLALGAAAAIVYAGYKYVTEPEKKETSVTQVSKPNPEPEENNQETEEQAENTNPPANQLKHRIPNHKNYPLKMRFESQRKKPETDT